MMPPLNPRGICRIAVVRANHRLGNTLLLLPLLSVLEEAFPGAEIDLITGGHAAAPLFREYRQVAAVHAFPAKSYASPASVLRLLRSLRRQRYDLAIDPTPKSRSGRFLLGWLQARHRLGYRWSGDRRNGSLTHAVPADGMPPHMAHAGVHLLRHVLAGAPAVPDELPPMDLRLTLAELEHGRARLLRVASPGSGPMVALYGAATGRKTYSRAWWSSFVHRLRELAPTARLIEFVPHDGRPRFGGELPVFFSLQPRDMAAVCRAMDLFVTADCGVMHLASAGRARVLGLFKATEATRYAPYGNGSTSLEAGDDAPATAAEHASRLLRGAPSSAPDPASLPVR